MVRPLTLLTAAAASVLAAAALVRRVEVDGPSMLPTLAPGDRLLVVRTRWTRPIRPGDIVVVPDPRRADRLLVKRVAAVTSWDVTVTGDNPGASTDSRTFGPTERHAIWGRAVLRYHPRPVGTLRSG